MNKRTNLLRRWGALPFSIIVAASCALVVGCGSSTPNPVEPVAQTHVDRHREAIESEPERQVQIEGLMGTISADRVNQAMEPRMDRFLRCFTDRYDAVRVLGGHIEMSFRIHIDGTVRWVYPSTSTIGDRATERCLLDVAGRARFSRPRGGEAEFAYPLDLDTPEDVRPPVSWSSSDITDVLEENGQAVVSSCRPRGSRAQFNVTAYVKRGGDVMAAGVSCDDPELSSQVLDCVADAVKSWNMPDPGSYPAKVSFTL